MTIELLLEDWSLGRKRKFRGSLFLHVLFFKCPQLKIINIIKCHILTKQHIWIFGSSMS